MTANSQTHAILHTNRNTQMSDVISNFAFFHSILSFVPMRRLCYLFMFIQYSFLFFNSSSCSFSLLHYCFLCILIFTKCQSNDEMPPRWGEQRKEKTRICVSSARRKETCVVTILNDMLMEYKILNERGSDAFNFAWKVYWSWIYSRTFTPQRRISHILCVFVIRRHEVNVEYTIVTLEVYQMWIQMNKNERRQQPLNVSAIKFDHNWHTSTT